MSKLDLIELRHRPDRWRDMIFVAGAALLTALSIGALTSKAAGSVTPHEWTLTVVEGEIEVSR